MIIRTTFGAVIDHTDIDLLKRCCGQIHAFGLGFIQIKLGVDDRIHLYTSSVKQTTEKEDIHTHPRSFRSTCLQGEIRNYVFDVSECWHGKFEMINTSCKPGFKPLPAKRVEVEQTLQFETSNSSSYALDSRLFHRVEADEGTITHIQKYGPLANSLELAKVVTKVGTERICPFSANTFTEDELWQIYESCL